MIDRATVDKIMDATNIVDVVGDFVTLRKAGVNYPLSRYVSALPVEKVARLSISSWSMSR